MSEQPEAGRPLTIETLRAAWDRIEKEMTCSCGSPLAVCNDDHNKLIALLQGRLYPTTGDRG